jgi:cytochrome c peroxidase
MTKQIVGGRQRFVLKAFPGRTAWLGPALILLATFSCIGSNVPGVPGGVVRAASRETVGGSTGARHCRPEVLDDGSARFGEALRRLEGEAWHRDGTWLMVLEGARNFVAPVPGGNGRSCATCHNPQDGFSISPETVETRWQRLQARRRYNLCADDPLFRSIDADDYQQDFTTLRSRALFRVQVPLPNRVRMTNDPSATHAVFFRAAPPLNLLKHTAPYQQDRSVEALAEQARNAIDAHMEPTVQPTQRFLESVAEFQRHIFSSSKVKLISDAIDASGPIPDTDPPLTAFEQFGKQKFDDFCRRCHGGPAMVQNLENRIFPPFDGSANPVSVNIVVSNPPAQGFPDGSPVQTPERNMPTQLFDVDLPDGTTVTLESSDPGTVLTDVASLETVGGNRVFNRFDIPQLHGINRTAPYFHDHRARTLEEVVVHYQKFFFLISQVRGFPLPLIADEDIAPIVAYMKKAF